MTIIDQDQVGVLIAEAVENSSKFLEANGLKEYPSLVLARKNLKEARATINQFNRDLSLEYRARKIASRKQPKVETIAVVEEPIQVYKLLHVGEVATPTPVVDNINDGE